MVRALRLAALASCLAVSLAAQESRGNVGIGVTLNPAALILVDDDEFALFSPTGFNNFLVSLRAGPVTLEPEFGLFRFATKTTGSGFSSEENFSNLRIGVGVLAALAERGNLRPYAGPRVGIIRSSSHSSYSSGGGTSEYTTKQTNTYISAVLGAQYFFSRHFSLGGEVQLTRVSFGDEKTEPPPSGTEPETSTSTIGTGGVVILRWFF
jgi:hypothetical protein